MQSLVPDLILLACFLRFLFIVASVRTLFLMVKEHSVFMYTTTRLYSLCGGLGAVAFFVGMNMFERLLSVCLSVYPEWDSRILQWFYA